MSTTNEKILDAFNKYNQGLKPKLENKFVSKTDFNALQKISISNTQPEDNSIWIDTSIDEE